MTLTAFLSNQQLMQFTLHRLPWLTKIFQSNDWSIHLADCLNPPLIKLIIQPSHPGVE